MFRKIFWINIGLFVIVLLLSYNFYKIWSQVTTQIKSPPVRIEAPLEPHKWTQEEEDELTSGVPMCLRRLNILGAGFILY